MPSCWREKLTIRSRMIVAELEATEDMPVTAAFSARRPRGQMPSRNGVMPSPAMGKTVAKIQHRIQHCIRQQIRHL
jgi:hypothetical protein